MNCDFFFPLYIYVYTILFKGLFKGYLFKGFLFVF